MVHAIAHATAHIIVRAHTHVTRVVAVTHAIDHVVARTIYCSYSKKTQKRPMMRSVIK